MNKVGKWLIATILVFASIFGAKAEIIDPVKWTFSAKQIAPNEYDLIATADISGDWHMYSQNIPPEGGPRPTAFVFTPSESYSLIGKVKEISKAYKEFDKNFEMEVIYFKKKAIFTQRVRINSATESIKGMVEFMVCNDMMCLPPTEVEFVFDVKFSKGGGNPDTLPSHGAIAPLDTQASTTPLIDTGSSSATGSSAATIEESARYIAKKEAEKSQWSIFFTAFLFGLAALITPCVFPMIPLTVGFFTKGKANRRKAILNSMVFGLSIVVIFVALGMLVTIIFGSDRLNAASSDPWVNFVYFLIFFIFALSFLGAFDIRLPSSWTTATDKQADRGGFLGIFFIASTLVLVSFSCTGIFIGNLLVIAAKGSAYGGPAIGMLGFALGLAVPFMIFAAAPGLMKSLPSSGGWLNAVKVTFGFLELAFALKFLSTTDQVLRWGILRREYFLALWVVIFVMLGLYLIGRLRLKHDSEKSEGVGVGRLLIALGCFAFSLYLVPGLVGAPIKLLSGILPPSQYNEGWTLNGAAPTAVAENASEDKKYNELFDCPHGLNCYFDYDEALAAAKVQKKPLMLDFTGIACTNCRKMEDNVWIDPSVLKRLNNDYILVSLYVDDVTPLPESEVYNSKLKNKRINSLGKKWSDFQATRFETNSQPYYVLVDHNERVLNEPRGYDPDVSAFVNFLDEGKRKFETGLRGAQGGNSTAFSANGR